MNTDLLTRELTETLDGIAPPTGDLGRAVSRGRVIRRRRAVVTSAATTAVAAVTAVGIAVTTSSPSPTGERVVDRYQPVGQLDFGEGLRAYASPDDEVHIGGRVVPWGDFPKLDTAATATSQGVVFFDSDRQPMLLGEDGRVRALGDRPATPDWLRSMREAEKGYTQPDLPADLQRRVDRFYERFPKRFLPKDLGREVDAFYAQHAPPPQWHVSTAADAGEPLVAWSQPVAEGVRFVVYDLAGGKQVAERTVPCDGEACASVRVDGLDSGLVFVRTAEGTFAWEYAAADGWRQVGDPNLRVADARNRVMLYSEGGSAPSDLPDGWTSVAGAIDATLSFDGRHILHWSTTLRPVGGSAPITLSEGPEGGEGDIYVAFDTDGSVLLADASGADGMTVAAVPENGDAESASADFVPAPSIPVYDCELPSGRCEPLGPLETPHGDPMFIGADM